MAVKVAVNGFGRIGRTVVRLARQRSDIEFVAINDLTDAATLAHLFKYDSVHGVYPGSVVVRGDSIVIDDQPVQVSALKDPAALPWGDLGVDIVVEGTGVFRKRSAAAQHLAAGARKVVVTAPMKDADITIVMGVNDADYDPGKHDVVSNASCTTNCLAPFAKVLDEQYGIAHGLMTTIHSYTNDQRVLDLPHSDLRRARAAGVSMIPTTTGAAAAVALVLPQLKGKLDGMAVRVPTPNVSIVDLTVTLERGTSADAINDALRTAAAGPLAGIMAVSDEPLVSCDFNGCTMSSTIDSLSTAVIGGRMAKVLSWYDNESGYSARILDLIACMARAL